MADELYWPSKCFTKSRFFIGFSKEKMYVEIASPISLNLLLVLFIGASVDVTMQLVAECPHFVNPIVTISSSKPMRIPFAT